MSDLGAVESFFLWFFFAYVLSCSAAYLLLNLIAFDTLRYHLRQRRSHEVEDLYSGLEPPISVIVPAYNEGTTIVSSLQSILALNYPNLEIIVVNDGSTDNTSEILRATFDFEEFPEAKRLQVPCQPIHRVYLSRKINNLRLVDKANGGKSDAINAGINLSRSPLFCCIDADSVLEPSSLIRVVQPFLQNPDVIATGGTVRIANGCIVKRGQIIRKGLPRNWLAALQVVEYLRAFLYGRIGWSRLKGLLIISGAFGLFRRDVVIKAGGYRTDTMGEDMELILRMYRTCIDENIPYRVEFIPDPVCWTEAPEKLSVFASQRRRWHRGLSESLHLNRSLLFDRRSGPVGWLSMPFFILFEWLSPFVELAGYLFSLYLIVSGRMSYIDAALVLLFAVLLSMTLSTVSFLLDEITFPGALKLRTIYLMVFYSFLECFGYRQLNMLYKIQGALQWLTRKKQQWGDMTRLGNWQK